MTRRLPGTFLGRLGGVFTCRLAGMFTGRLAGMVFGTPAGGAGIGTLSCRLAGVFASRFAGMIFGGTPAEETGAGAGAGGRPFGIITGPSAARRRREDAQGCRSTDKMAKKVT